MNQIIQNIQQVKQRIEASVAACGEVGQPNLLAVSKKHSVDKIRLLAEHGQRDFGESYAQEGVDKINQCKNLALVWHFIGPIQSNKAKLIATHFDWVHSVDRMKIVNRLKQHRSFEGSRLQVLLQLKVGDELTKSGANSDALLAMAEVVEAAENLTLRGLMCIPPPSQAVKEQKAYFMEAKHVYDSMQSKYAQVDTLSMGMSNDLEAAIACGSTMVRIGTDIFGKRVG